MLNINRAHIKNAGKLESLNNHKTSKKKTRIGWAEEENVGKTQTWTQSSFHSNDNRVYQAGVVHWPVCEHSKTQGRENELAAGLPAQQFSATQTKPDPVCWPGI